MWCDRQLRSAIVNKDGQKCFGELLTNFQYSGFNVSSLCSCGNVAQVIVAGQVLPVPTSIRMQLTSAHISFQPNDIDFGLCNLGEKTGVCVAVTNHSVLPQKYGGFAVAVMLHLLFVPFSFCGKFMARHYAKSANCRVRTLSKLARAWLYPVLNFIDSYCVFWVP